MKSFKLKIQSTKPKEDFTILYEDSTNQIHKIEAHIDDILNSLHYFQKRGKEIGIMKSIYIHEDIPFELFDKFIKSIQTQELDIDADNYQIFMYLCEKYEYFDLQQQIQGFIQNRPDINSIINEITSNPLSSSTVNCNNEEIDFLKEEMISKNLDISLKNGNMRKIPLKKLNRILNSPKMTIDDHHLLFSFVISMIKEKLNEKLSPEEHENLLLLPSSLDYCRMTKEEIEELFQTEKSLHFFQPRHSKEKIESMIVKEKEMSMRIDELEKQIKSNENFFNQKIEETKQLFETSLKRIQKIELSQKNLTEKDVAFGTRIDNVESNQSSFNGKLEEHNSRISKNEKSIRNLDVRLKKQEEEEKKRREEEEEKKRKEEEEKKRTKECPNGIFKYLFDKYGTNPDQKGIIKIDGNSHDEYHKSKLPKIIESDWTSDYWCSQYVQNSYIRIDFNKFLVKIDKYKIKVGATDNDYFFTSWTLKGVTEDGQEVILDDVNNSSEITKSHPEATVCPQSKPFVRSIQITMKGDHNKGSISRYAMVFRNIEIYGRIRE